MRAASLGRSSLSPRTALWQAGAWGRADRPRKKMKHAGPSDGVAAKGDPKGHRGTADAGVAAMDAALAAPDALSYILAPLGDCDLTEDVLPEDYASLGSVQEQVFKLRCPAEVEHGGSRGRGGGGGGGRCGGVSANFAALESALSQLKRAKAHHACWVKSERADPRKSRELNKQTTLAAKQAYAAQLWRAEVLQQEARFTEDAQPPQRLLLDNSQIQYMRHLIQSANHFKDATSFLNLATRQLRCSSKKEDIRTLGAHVLLSFSFSACNTSWTDTLEKIHDDIDRLQSTPRKGPFSLKVVMLLLLLWFSSLPPPPPPVFGGLHRRHGWAQLRKLLRALFLFLLLFIILLLIRLILLVSPSSAVRGGHLIRGGTQLKKTDGLSPTLAPGPPRFP